MRECGTCSMCCKLLEIEELKKAEHTWCRFVKKGSGCSIYKNRPTVCSNFQCGWLTGHLGDEWFPRKSGMVVFTGKFGSTNAIVVSVDRNNVNRWKEEPYWSQIWGMSIRAMKDSKAVLTVFAGSHRYLVLGENVYEDPADDGEVSQVGPDQWSFTSCPVGN